MDQESATLKLPMTPVTLFGEVELASSPHEIWPLLTDTNRLNQGMGMPPMTFEPADPSHPGPVRFTGIASIFGIRHRFQEFPFEWTYGKVFRSFRIAENGPLRSVLLAYRLEALGSGDAGGTRLSFALTVEPRAGIFRLIAWLFAKSTLGKLTDIARSLDAHVANNTKSPFDVATSRPNAGVLSSAVRELKKSGVEQALADRLGAWVAEAPDAELVRIRPFELADDWQVDRMKTLHAVLHAVPAGLLELRWSIICPSCLTASEEAQSLGKISAQGHCALCDIQFEIDLDQAVEATFTPHPSARAVARQMFCSGGPARTPHVKAQANLAISETKELEVPEEDGRYRVFARGGAIATLELQIDAPARAILTFEDGVLRPAKIVARPGGTVAVTNLSDDARHVKLERFGYASQSATAHLVSTLDEFRSIFSSELLKPSTPLKVARAAILFSDLVGSTALYSTIGDAAAFRLVDDHFDMMRAVLVGHEGALIKTMGDAVMASFHNIDACVGAAIDALSRLGAFRVGREHGALVAIKLGINAGPCYIVTANGALDYFGQTVNVASRIQHLAQAGELVMPVSLWNEVSPEVRRAVQETERFLAQVKGVAAPLELVRLRLAASD
jgi:class 3 adenylate cyclase